MWVRARAVCHKARRPVTVDTQPPTLYRTVGILPYAYNRARDFAKEMHVSIMHPSSSSTPDLLVHFIFGLSDDTDERRFTFAHYIAVRAAFVHLKPCKLLMHYHHLPLGKWWSHASRLVELRHVELPQEIFGRQIKSGAHRADVLRLQLLLAHGGLYLDLDVVVLHTFHGLLRGRKSFLIGREGHPSHGGFHGLCNAVLLARPNASFARRWLDEYHDFGDPRVGDLWSEHSVQRPIKLAAAHPDEVHVLPYNAFFWPDWDEPLLRTLVLERSRLPHVAAATELTPSDRSAAMRPPQHPDPSDGFSAASEDAAEREYAVSDEPPPSYASYAVHLFSSLSTPFVLRQWSLEYLASVPASLNCNIYAALSAHYDYSACRRIKIKIHHV